MTTIMHNPQLNIEQLAAVNHLDGPLLVLAGAGSGKTRVVTYRIIELLNNQIPPEKILALTFTNKAAMEMKERIRSLTNAHVLISTFHSLGVRILRESIHHIGYNSDFVIYDEEDSNKLLRSCLKKMHISEKEAPLKTLKRLISKSKNDLSEPTDTSKANSTVEQILPEVYKPYQRGLQDSNAVDFDDLLFLPIRLFQEHPEVLEQYQHRWFQILVDEYQDTNQAQYTLTRMLVAKSRNLFVVGDPDQSIYAWRGADIKNILSFEDDWPDAKIIKLEQNYRSTCNILNGANALIQNNESRYAKKLWSALGNGEKIHYKQCKNDQDEANFVVEQMLAHHQNDSISLNSFVIFYRTNAQSRIFEDVLLRHDLPYVVIGGISFYHRREIKDILAFLKMVHSSTDVISFTRTINLPRRGIGDTTIAKLVSGANQANMTLFDFCVTVVYDDTSLVKLSAKQKSGLKSYTDLIQSLRDINQEGSLNQLVVETIRLSNYLSLLEQDKETLEDRKANVDELIAKATEWEKETNNPTLSAFLEELTLKTSLDDDDGSTETISLMTMHNGKGLEFEIAFLVGMEDMLIPHINSKDSPDGLEEERRLCYVGMTRAKRLLYLTSAKMRFLWGSLRSMRPSRFLQEIPPKFITKQQTANTGYYDYSESEPANKEADDEMNFDEGDVVFHNDFGIGKLTKIGNCSLGTTYTIEFQKDGTTKTLVAKLAKLKKLK